MKYPIAPITRNPIPTACEILMNSLLSAVKMSVSVACHEITSCVRGRRRVTEVVQMCKYGRTDGTSPAIPLYAYGRQAPVGSEACVVSRHVEVWQFSTDEDELIWRRRCTAAFGTMTIGHSSRHDCEGGVERTLCATVDESIAFLKKVPRHIG